MRRQPPDYLPFIDSGDLEDAGRRFNLAFVAALVATHDAEIAGVAGLREAPPPADVPDDE